MRTKHEGGNLTLTKAIEILQLNIQEAGNKMPPDCKQAIQLGIDALIRVLDVRRFPEASNWKPLPSETEE